MKKSYNSFSDFFAAEKVEVRKEVEKAVHNDENIANNRLFVWNFEEADLEEFLEYFNIFKGSPVTVSSRMVLSGNLTRKMNALIREGYNPIECMLYASKTINMRLQNDRELQMVLAEKIRDVYLKQEAESIAVLNNIIDMWAWVPQIVVVITAIGKIGENQELLDKIMRNYVDKTEFRSKVFYAVMENKNMDNLERALQIIMSLQDTEEDRIIGKVFTKEFSGFGFEGVRLLRKYYENPAITRAGGRVLTKIMLREGNPGESGENERLYRKALANKSYKDDLAFKDFKEDCYEHFDDDAFFLARFSRAEIGDFLSDALASSSLTQSQRNTAIISMATAGNKGYYPAAAIIRKCEIAGNAAYAVMVANIILGEEEYAQKLAQTFSEQPDHRLHDLYRILTSSGIVTNNYSKRIVQEALEDQFNELLSAENYKSLEYLTSNFQIFWDKKLWGLISMNLLDDMVEVLIQYAANQTQIPAGIILSLIETVVQSWNGNVEKAIFALYKNSDEACVRELSFRKLKERKIEAPR